MSSTYAELHGHSNFSFLHGASPVEDMAERAAELGLSGLAITDHDGLYGVVRFTTAAAAAGIRPIIGIEIELQDAAVADPGGIVVPARRRLRGRGPAAGGATGGLVASDGAASVPPIVIEGLPARPRPERARLPGHRRVVKEDLRGIGERQRGPHLVLLARDAIGYRSLCRLVSRANLDGTKRVPRFTHELLARHREGLIVLSGGRQGEIARRLLVGDREGARAVAERYAALFGRGESRSLFIELSHHLRPDDDWLVAEHAALAEELGLPVVVTNDVHYARPEDRELHDVLTGIFHGRTLETLGDLRRPDGESYLKSGAELAAMPPGEPAFATADPRTARAWAEGIATSGEVAAACTVDLGFEQYRFPGFAVPNGETPFSYLSELCWAGARKRYHPLTAVVMSRLAHELGVIERAGLAEFFLICWDLMRFAKKQGIPAQGRGSATSSIVSYTLGISRVEPIAHNLLFERFINEGRTTYPDVDIDFSSERREEVIQYVYRRYGPEHTGMVCNLVTYRARSAVREVGYALGFPRPLVDRVAKALETYDSVMVRRDLEADGGFAEFFRRPGEGGSGQLAEDAVLAAASLTGARGLTDAMGQLAHARGGRISTGGAGGTGGAGERGDGRMARPEDVRRLAAERDETPGGTGAAARVLEIATETGAVPVGEQLIDGIGQLNGRMPLVGKVPPWRQPAKPPDPAAPRPFAWVAGGGDGRDGAADPAGRAGDPAGKAGDGRSDPETRRTFTPRALSSESTAPAASERSAAPAIISSQAWGGTNPEQPEAKPADSDGWISDNAPRVQIRHKSDPAAADEVPERAGPGRSGMWDEAPESPPAIRAGGRGDDEGGPGDTPASVAWLRAGRGTGYGAPGRGPGRAGSGAGDVATGGTASGSTTGDGDRAPGLVDGRAIDPESGAVAPPARTVDRLGRPNHWDTAGKPSPTDGNIRGGIGVDRVGRADPHREGREAQEPRSSVARIEPEPPPQARGGSTVGMSDWERWLEFCARIDGFPRHLSIHSGGMLVTAAPLIDIAPIERATMQDRVVVQFDKRDVEELKLIKLDLLGLGMLAAIDETVQLIEHDCGTCVVLDSIPEQVPEVFQMLQAADTVGVFQVESRAQMQTLPKSKPSSLDDLVVEVAIIRPGPIQGNAVHPYLRRKQGIEPVTYLHPSLEPVLKDSMGVILYQEQVMRIAIEVAGFTPAESDGFRRAMGTWRSNREMEKLHRQFHDGCMRQPGMTEEVAEELFRQVSAFASFGFAKSHAAAFARTAYESSFLKLFYPAQFLVGLINAQPMGFYPVEVLVNDTKRHGIAVLPVDLNASSYRTTTEWVGRPGWALAGAAGDDGSHDDEAASPGEELPEGSGIEVRPRPVRSSSCLIPGAAAREQWTADSSTGWGVRLGLHLVKGIGEQHAELLDRELEHGPYVSLADVVERTGLPEETIERLIRTGALDSLGRPRRELLWQLREVAGVTRGRGLGSMGARRVASGGSVGTGRSPAAGRPMDLRLPPTEAPVLPAISESERLGDAYAVVGLDAKLQVVALFREALDRLGAVPNAALADRRTGPVRLGGLVVTRQHPMTAKGTVFLALEDETGMVNVTLWPDTWARLRSVVRRHALLLVDGDLQRESSVINVFAHDIRPLTSVAEGAGGPETPAGVRQLGHAGMRRLG
ncbi:MAG TPA: PHP domain-containing protein [Candidatus Limnocylindria bacterium]|nr:PHP domain-containing protein [Candidatus Limnocylindria bacterium]